jgi:hypothetical protein
VDTVLIEHPLDQGVTLKDASGNVVFQYGVGGTVITLTDVETVTLRNAAGLVIYQNHAPMNLTISRSSLFSDTAGAWISDIWISDADGGDTHTYASSDPRFVVTGRHLYLQPGVAIDRLLEPAVTLAITVTDAGGASFTSDFTLTLLPRPADWNYAYQWPLNHFDVDASNLITPLDALLIINLLNALGPGGLPQAAIGTVPAPFYDVSGDDVMSPLDAVLVINRLNSGGVVAGESSAEAWFGLPIAAEIPIAAQSLPSVDESTVVYAWWMTLDPSGIHTRPATGFIGEAQAAHVQLPGREVSPLHAEHECIRRDIFAEETDWLAHSVDILSIADSRPRFRRLDSALARESFNGPLDVNPQWRESDLELLAVASPLSRLVNQLLAWLSVGEQNQPVIGA